MDLFVDPPPRRTVCAVAPTSNPSARTAIEGAAGARLFAQGRRPRAIGVRDAHVRNGGLAKDFVHSSGDDWETTTAG